MAARGRGKNFSLPQDVATTIGKDDDQVHYDEDQVVMPAVSALAPKTGMPSKDFFLDGAKHDENESQSGKLRQDTKDHTETSCDFSYAQKQSELPARADAFAPCCWILEVVASAGDDNYADQQPQSQQPELGEA